MSLINPQDKIFIAGHNGMVGSSILRSLKKKKYKNILIASKEELDLRNQNKVDEWFLSHKPNVVILAAAKVGGIGANSTYPVDFLLDNIKIQSNVIESAWKNDSHRLLFLGSSCIYPKYAQQPIMEEALLEGALEKTNEWYAIAKITGIKLCDALREQYGFDALSLMPTNLYGPGDNFSETSSHVIPGLLRRMHKAKLDNEEKFEIWGTGKPLREFLFAQDLADCIEFIMDKELDQSLINVGSGQEVSILQLANMIKSVVGFQGDLSFDSSKPDGNPRKLLDSSKLNSYGWSAKTSLSDGLKTTYRWYLDNIDNIKV
mgnify:CR=1 FL=1